jgi:hypothetical protein
LKKVTDPLTQKKNKQNIDILGNLFKGSAGDPSIGLEELSELTYRKRPSTETLDKLKNREGFPQKNRRKKQLKRKLSYSISRNKVGEDNTATVKIKIVVPAEIKNYVSKSGIVDCAIKSFLEELKSAVEE